MALTVLSVAYPFAPVGPDTAGGAEQVLSAIDAALVQAGHRSLVVARTDSQVKGRLIPVPARDGPLSADAIAAGEEQHRRAIAAALDRWQIDVIHLHGVDFHRYVPPPGPPALVTLHLPANHYPAGIWSLSRPDTWFHGVSQTQHGTLPAHPALLPPIENGVSSDFFASRHAKRRFALMLTRICPEKGIHLAIEAAKTAGVPLLIAGAVFPYRDHQSYFREEIMPRLDDLRRFIGPVGARRKRRLLAAARCVVVSSLVPETSSLAAREALASGTPVIALRRGALPEIVRHGITGFLVDDEHGLADAIRLAPTLDPSRCRDSTRERLSLERMTGHYLALYRRLAACTVPARGAA